MSGSFVSDLGRELDRLKAHEQNEHQCFVRKVKVASFQADSLIARRALTDKSQLIFANDTDFMVLVGQKCVAVRDFKAKRSSKKSQSIYDRFDSFDIGCCGASTFDNILATLSDEERRKVQTKKTTYPLLDEENIKLRATVAVILGSDVFVGGIQGVGASAIRKEMEKWRNTPDRANNSDDELREHMVKWACQKDKSKAMTREIFETFTDALLFEPSNEKDAFDNGASLPEYIHGRHPCSLPAYLKEFSYQGTEEQGQQNFLTRIVPGPETCMCIGPLGDKNANNGGGEHLVLKGEGVVKCEACRGHVCLTCRAERINKEADDVTNPRFFVFVMLHL